MTDYPLVGAKDGVTVEVPHEHRPWFILWWREVGARTFSAWLALKHSAWRGIEHEDD